MTAPAPPVDPWLCGTLVIRMAWVVTLAGLAGLGWLLTTEYAFLGGIPGVVALLGLIGVLSESLKRRKARAAIRAMQTQGAWLHWHVPPALWSAHARRTLRRRLPWTVILGLLGAFIAGLVTVVGPWFMGWQPSSSGADFRITAPDGWQFASGALGLFGGIGLICDIVNGIMDRAIIRHGHVAIIGPQGAIVGGEFATFVNHPLLQFAGVTLTGPPDPVLALQFAEARFTYNAGAGSVTSARGLKVLSLPVPPGWEDDAQRVVAALQPA
ncbi:MAG: hypothetical protein JJT88_15710 [Gammaproteobacteria bacterium]|nr:hypothetical protein [Gammaproteobacteria bacterium]